MPRPWKSKNDFHRRLESSPKRELPTFPQANLLLDARSRRRKRNVVLPMYPVRFVTDVSGCAGGGGL
jgi:hypothetical protein